MQVLKFLGMILLLIATPAMGKSDSATAWIVAQKSGDVHVIRSGLRPASVHLNAALAPGDIVATGGNGRAMLTRGDDYVVISPNGRLVLPRQEQATGMTRLLQQLGTMLYKVRHTGTPHFAVETPMLAAVVKGTTFTVVVDKDRSAVQVTEGAVEVGSAVGDARRLVKDGMTVYVGRERPNEIIEVKSVTDLPATTLGKSVRIEGSGEVPLSAVTAITNGLVREAVVAPVITASIAPDVGVVVADATAGGSSGTATPDVADGEIVDTVVAPVSEPASDVVAGVTEPVADVVEPVVDVVADVTEPVVDVVEPVVDVVADVTEPVVEVVEPVVDVVEDVTEPVVEVVEDVTAPVVDVVEDVSEPVVEVVEDVTEPVVEVVEDVTEPVVEVVEDVTEPVVEVVEPVVDVVEPVVGVVEPVVTVIETVPSVPGIPGL